MGFGTSVHHVTHGCHSSDLLLFTQRRFQLPTQYKYKYVARIGQAEKTVSNGSSSECMVSAKPHDSGFSMKGFA
jgi:hypothetical protein